MVSAQVASFEYLMSRWRCSQDESAFLGSIILPMMCMNPGQIGTDSHGWSAIWKSVNIAGFKNAVIWRTSPLWRANRMSSILYEELLC